MSWIDLTQDEAGKDFTPLKNGEYTVVCVDAEVKQTKTGTGEMIACKFEVAEPKENRGRIVFHNFNIKNQSAEAVRIGREQIKRFMIAAGRKDFKLSSPGDLCGLSAVALVGIDDKGYNRIKTFIIEETEGSFDKIESASVGVAAGTKVDTKKPTTKRASW